MNLDETIAKAKKASENQHMNDRFRENTKQLAEWLEELKQYKEENQPEKSDGYQKQETNLDHYKDGIIELCLDDLAISKGKVVECGAIPCSECDFTGENSPCIGKFEIKKWLNQQYIKPTYELTKFEFDLLQSYPSKYKFKDIPVLDRMKKKEYFKGADEDTRIKDILADCEITEED